MEFKEFKKLMQNHVAKMIQDQTKLYVVDTDNDELWNIYLESFPPEHNKVFKERREYDCSCCRSFIRSFGSVVAIKDNEITTVWDFYAKDSYFQQVINAMSKYVKSKKIQDVFITNQIKFGTDVSRTLVQEKVVEWQHFRIELPTQFMTRTTKTLDTVKSELRAVKEVFKRSLEELSLESIETVLELIAQNSLYKGEEWKQVLTTFKGLHVQYSSLPKNKKDIFCWDASSKVGAVIGKIKNHSIGVLLTDISENMDLDTAVKRYEKIVAPSNYKRPKAIFTQKMIDQAQKTLEGLGLLESLERRYATINDITVNNVLFANKDSVKAMKGGDIFSSLKKEATSNKLSFNKLEEVSVETFIKEILPSVTDIEAYFENKHVSNLVSLISPKNIGSKTMFKWNNNFSWAYNGNITDSMKENVKNAGGKVDGVLRFSIQWNDKGDNENDFDAHCVEPNGNRIYYQSKRGHLSTGELDVDIMCPDNKVAVENITWSNKSKMKEGIYTFTVHTFNHRGGKSGFSAEIEFDGQVYSFEYRRDTKRGEHVPVAKVEYTKANGFKIIESLSSSMSQRTEWNISTNQFQPVSVLMYSPNYWDNQNGIGNRHYFFMLKECKNVTKPNGFFNEYLKEDLMMHKHVFEALGNKMHVVDDDNQLSGLGFSSTQRNALVCKLSGKFTRTIKVMF